MQTDPVPSYDKLIELMNPLLDSLIKQLNSLIQKCDQSGVPIDNSQQMLSDLQESMDKIEQLNGKNPSPD